MITIKAIPRGNPQDIAAPAKFYAHAIAAGEVDLERLAYLVSNQCTVRESDCHAVLMALMHNVVDELRQGRVVDMGILGRFQVGVRSKGLDVAHEVNSASVRSAHLNFRPGKRLRKMLLSLDYKLIDG